MNITVYCASSPDAPQEFIEAAYRLGFEAGGHGWSTVTGAGTTGLMGAVVDGTLAGGGKAIGVIPRFMVDRGWANPKMTALEVVETMAERKERLIALGNAAIALPGGIGTLDELMDLLTRCQLGMYDNPVVILNYHGFYDNLLAQLRHADSCSMMRHLGLPGDLWLEARTPDEAIGLIASANNG